MNKENFRIKGVVGNKSISEVTDKYLELINKHTRRDYTKEEIYVYPVHACDNEGDRDGEYFEESDLKKLANLFIGKTFIKDHSWGSSNQHSRIFKAKVENVKDKVIEVETKNKGKPFKRLTLWAYTVREGNEALINQIDGGILKEVSIGFGFSDLICDICGNSYYDGNKCHHYPGSVYEGKTAYMHMKDPTEAYEISFVAVPAQQNAGVIKGMKKDKFKGLKQGKKENRNKTKTERSIFYADFEKGGNKSMDRIKDLIKDAKAAKSDDITISIEDIEKEIGIYDSIVKKAADLEEEKKSLEDKAKMGEQYITDLKAECLRLGKLTEGDSFNEKTMESVFDKCEVDELKEFEASYKKKYDEKYPPNPQAKNYEGDEGEEDITVDAGEYQA